MKTKLTILILLLTLSVSAQFKAVEFTFSNEDKGMGGNIYLLKNNFGLMAGYEHGNYRFTTVAKVRHDKYRLGLSSKIFSNDSYSNGGSFIIYAATCYNKYDEIYDKYNHIKDNLPEITCEVGVKFLFPNSRIFSGFQYDITHRTGGFSVGLKLNK